MFQDIDAGIVIPLVVSGVLYVRGVRRLWSRAGPGRGIRTWEAWAFLGGWVTLAIALVSPLHRLGESLFSAHMAQHMLLMTVAAPLLVLGHPLRPFLWALPRAWRRRLGRAGQAKPVRASWLALTDIGVAWMVQAIALWLWHVPRLYEATLRSDVVHAVQHVSLLGTALLFWWTLVHGRRRQAPGAAVLSVFTTALHSGALGALLTFSTVLWYPAYGSRASAWGLSALHDQQLAGLIMWIPGSISYFAAALLLVAAMLREGPSEASRTAGPLMRGKGLAR